MNSPQTNLFRINRNDNAGLHYRIDGSHPKYIPGMKCATCGQTWISAGLNYPTIRPPQLRDLDDYLSKNTISPEDFSVLAQRLDQILGRHYPIKPFSAFGPLKGTVVGHPPDIAFGIGDCWVKQSAYEALRRRGLRGLAGVTAELRFRRKGSEPFIELELTAKGRFAQRSMPATATPCASCGRWDFDLPEVFWIQGSSLPNDLDIFRLEDWPAFIVVTERFVTTVKSLSLVGAVFEPVNVDPS